MFEHLPFLQKLWDKGIDIAASIITSVAIAGIAVIGWRIKLYYELKSEAAKQRQHHQIDEELAAEPRRRQATESYVRLTEQREAHGAAVQACRTGEELVDGWGRYENWLQVEGLENLPRNVDFLQVAARERDHMRQNAHTQRLAASLSDGIRRTQLPERAR